MIKVSNTSPQVLSPTASDPIHKEVREARVTHDGTILPSLKHANDYDYNQLDDKIDALSATSSTSLSVLQVAVDTLDTRLDVAEPKITTLQSEMATEKPKITSLQSDMTAEKAKIAGLQADNTTNKANIATLQSGKADKLMATNLITNGDFSNGTTGWNMGTEHASVTNGELNVTQTSGRDSFDATQYITPSQLTNSKYYIRFNYKLPSEGVQYLSVRLRDMTAAVYNDFGHAPISSTGVMNTFSGIKALNSYQGAGRLYLTAKYVDAATGAGKTITFDNISLINLTATFGAGNEPTLAEMDLLMSQFSNSWFDGTQELLSLKAIQKELSSKADKVQEAWITPTLLNGWSAIGSGNPVQYMKDSLGFVHLKGTATGGTINTPIFILPAGYTPLHYVYQAVDANNAHGRLLIDSAWVTGEKGRVALNVGSGPVSLHGIVFKAG